MPFRCGRKEEPMARNGYIRYLEHQFHFSGSFAHALFTAIELADDQNLERLAQGFPEEVEAYKVWSRVGAEELLNRAGEDCYIVQQIRAGKLFL